MPQINQLSSISQVSGANQIPVYDQNNGDARKMSVSALLQYFQTTFAAPTVATNLYVPGTGFNITVPTPVSEQQWMLLQPAGTLATGTITLPLNTGVPDGTQVLITSTQQITSLTIALNGAAAIFGAATSLNAGAAVAYRFYQPTNSWYQISDAFALIYGTGVEAWLKNPTSANLRSAMTDETGSGLLVFNTSPALVTPVLGTPTSGTLTNCTGLPNAGLVNSSVTIGGTAIALGASSSAIANDVTFNSVKVGRGNNSIATNTALGTSALAVNTTGSESTAVGASSLAANLDGVRNVAVGSDALKANLDGRNNVAVGASALQANTSGVGNIGLGARALYQNISGDANIAMGTESLNASTTADGNIAIGFATLFLTNAGDNIAIGGSSLYNNSTGTNNVGIGIDTLFDNTQGSSNVALGKLALQNNTVGNGNTAINPLNAAGIYAPVFDPTNEQNRVCFGSTSVTNAYIQVAWTVVSDARDKTDFAPVPHGLDFVSKLKPTAYRYTANRGDTEGHGPLRYGFKAQDILEIEGDNPVIVDAEDTNKLKFNDQSMIAVLVNAIQELQAQFEAYKATHP